MATLVNIVIADDHIFKYWLNTRDYYHNTCKNWASEYTLGLQLNFFWVVLVQAKIHIFHQLWNEEYIHIYHFRVENDNKIKYVPFNEISAISACSSTSEKCSAALKWNPKVNQFSQKCKTAESEYWLLMPEFYLVRCLTSKWRFSESKCRVGKSNRLTLWLRYL